MHSETALELVTRKHVIAASRGPQTRIEPASPASLKGDSSC